VMRERTSETQDTREGVCYCGHHHRDHGPLIGECGVCECAVFDADDKGEHTSRAWRWLSEMAQTGRGEVRFGITEDGDTGVWWDAYCGGEWTLGVGDTAEEAVASAMRRHPRPDAEPVVDAETRARWQAWRVANGRAA
jgi:hypothetical protein